MPLLRLCWITIILIASPAFADIKGLYGSDCFAAADLSAQKDLLFKGETLETVQTVYSDAACGSPAYDFSFVGHYTAQTAENTLDYTYESIKLRVLDERVAETFNEAQLCGISEWLVNEDYEVSGLDCGGQILPPRGTVVFDRLKEMDNGIVLGQANELEDGLSAMARPTEFDPRPYLPK